MVRIEHKNKKRIKMKLLLLALITLAATMFLLILAEDSDDMAPIYDLTQIESLWSAFKAKFNKTYNNSDEIYRLHLLLYNFSKQIYDCIFSFSEKTFSTVHWQE